MKGFERKAVWFIAIVSMAAAALAQQNSIRLPADNSMAQLKSGEGDAVVRRDCVICHSTDYIVRQPHLDAAHWDAEVKKMVNTFGAPIPAADVKVISDYLAKNYGTDATAESKPAAAKP